MRDARERGRTAREFRLPHTKVSDEQVAEIRRRYNPKASLGRRGHMRSNARELAAEFGLTPIYVQQIVYGRYRKEANRG
jgi:hypothetical protein